jgi:hypothetical protein
VVADGGRTQTLNFLMMRGEFYDCAIAAGLVIVTKNEIFVEKALSPPFGWRLARDPTMGGFSLVCTFRK